MDLQRLWIRKHRRLNWVKDDLTEVIRDWRAAARSEFDIQASVPAAPRRARDSARSTSFTATNVARLYNFPAEFDGSGQCVGILQLGGGLRQADISAYMAALGLTVPKITFVSVDGAANAPGEMSDIVVAVNVEIIATAAPGADIAVYFAPDTPQGFVDAILAAASDTVNNPSVLCITWGQPESGWAAHDIDTMNDALMKAAARGITCLLRGGRPWAGGGRLRRKGPRRLPGLQSLCACLRRHPDLGEHEPNRDRGGVERPEIWRGLHRRGVERQVPRRPTGSRRFSPTLRAVLH